MSTFDGHVAEFPRIRIDRFRLNDGSTVPSLANFLSHIHTDHLVGLDSPSYGGPFIYCSSATREMLLRLEKYPTRMNFAHGLTEDRTQTYKHLKKLLKPIPLEVPTWIELSDGHRIRVTLFDANHCAGAVSFLIEGDGKDSKAIIYTGDVRSEQWWVQSLTRYSFLNPYLLHGGKESHKRLDTIYLDTTFGSKSDPYQHFPSKAEGISELLGKLSRYPKDTVFYLNTWTFGYEDVWQAVATYLDTRIHVDQYKYGVYASLGNSKEPKALDYFKLISSSVGNHAQQGCLAADGQLHQVHSCEQGTSCYVWNEDFVRITPIISRHGGRAMREPGAGGGEDDLNRQYEIQFADQSEFIDLMELIVSKYQDQPELRASIMKLVKDDLSSRGTVSLEMTDVHPKPDADAMSQESLDMDDLKLADIVTALENRVTRIQQMSEFTEELPKKSGVLPKHIMFPYSRHSSYGELCALIEAFKPKDIFPCTEVPEKHWKPNHSMAYLFGHLYDQPTSFRHDQIMLRKLNERLAAGVASSPPLQDLGSTPAKTPAPSSAPPVISSMPTRDGSERKHAEESRHARMRSMLNRKSTEEDLALLPATDENVHSDSETDEEMDAAELNHPIESSTPAKVTTKRRSTTESQGDQKQGDPKRRIIDEDRELPPATIEVAYSDSETDEEMGEAELKNAFRMEASDAAQGNFGMHWSAVGLVSVSGHQKAEEEL